MDIFRSNTILDSFESSPALRYNLFFASAMPTQKRGFSLRSGLEFQAVCLSKPQMNK